MFSSVHLTRNITQRSYQALHRAASTSAQPSMSEASEALQHVTEADKKEAETEKPEKRKVPKIDREKNLNLTYSIASVEKLEAVNKLLYASYHPDEPITRHLGLYKGVNSIPDADRRVEAMILRNLSMFAYNSQGELIGVCINNGYYKHDFLELLNQSMEETVDPAYKPFLAIHKAIRENNLGVFDELKANKMFNVSMVGVDPSYRGKGVATDLIRRSILLAGCMGFTGIMTEATGKFSQKAFSTIHMLKTNSILYRDFEFEGKKVFEDMDPVHPEIAFMKKKFFQSCLKHIL